jgi:hypothetical protein
MGKENYHRSTHFIIKLVYRNEHTQVKTLKIEMISFDHRVLSEYRIKIAKIETLSKSIMTHRDPKGPESRDASDFLDVLINETDKFYENNSDVLSNNGKRPHARSRLSENKQWIENIEKFYEKNPRRTRK